MAVVPVLSNDRLLKWTRSRCPRCLRDIPAQVFERDGRIVMAKACAAHGRFEATLANDARFYHVTQGSQENAAGGAAAGSCCGDGGCCGAQKSSVMAREAASGAVADHAARKVELGRIDPFEMLSTCIALIEIVDSCNLSCPTCYAASPWGVGAEVDCTPYEEFVARVSGVIARKGFIDILQLSGGEPTIHPRFFDILEWSLAQPQIGYVLVNTNAVRIAVEEDFRARLGALRRARGKFELYMQFDGPQREGQMELRAADLREVRRKAIDEAGALGVPTTLAMTVTPTTLRHLGDTLRFGLERPHCRGITFQPMFNSGRVPETESSLPLAPPVPPAVISVGDVILNLVEQSDGLLTIDDFTPLPCGDPNCHTIGYLLRLANGPTGLSRLLDLNSLKGFLQNRVDYRLEDLARCGCETEPLGAILKQFEIGPDAPFRIFIKPFMDAWTFDQDRIDRCCTHVIRPDGTLDSFCRYYLERGMQPQMNADKRS